MASAPAATTPAGARSALESADVKAGAPAAAMLSVDDGNEPWLPERPGLPHLALLGQNVGGTPAQPTGTGRRVWKWP